MLNQSVIETDNGFIQYGLFPEEEYSEPDIPTNPNIIIDPDAVSVVLDAVEAASVIGIDTETTGLDHVRDTLHGVSISTEEGGWYVTGPALLPFLQGLTNYVNSDRLWVGHNFVYDFHFLGRYGCIPNKYFDTLIGQWLIDENQDLGLKALAYTKLGVTGDIPEFKDMLHEAKKRLKKKRLAEVTIYDIPLDTLGSYAIRDTDYTLALYKITAYELEQEGLTDVFWNVEMPFLTVIYDMEEYGMRVDLPLFSQLQREYGERIEALYKKWNELTGGVNPNSPPQLGELMFKKMQLPMQGKTAKGNPITDALVIQRLEPMDETGALKTLSEIRKIEKLKSTYVDAIIEKQFDGRIYGKYKQHGARTGRLSANDPNLQNIPGQGDDGKKIRSGFIAKEGYDLLVCDYSQIELRLLAHDSRDEDGFLKVFHEGGDPHQSTCDLICALGYTIARKQAKSVNFGWVYGMGPRTLADNLEKVTGERPAEKDTKMWLDGFDQAKPRLVKYRTNVIKRTRQLGHVVTMGGRKRRLPDISSPVNSLRFRAERQAVNTRIQGSAADLIKWAMIQLRPWCKLYGVRMVAQVHDEIVFESPKAVTKEFMPIVQNIMESVKEQFNLCVPIEAVPGVGPDWSVAK